VKARGDLMKKRRTPKFLRAMIARRQQNSTHSVHVLSGAEANVQKEVDYVLQRARAGDSRVVGFGQLVFFSTQTRDGWMLD